MKLNCCFCKLNVSDRAKSICCDRCNEWIHMNCNKLPVLSKLILMKITSCSKQINIDENNSGHSNISINLLNLLSQINNLIDHDNSEDENLLSSKYQDISYFMNHIII